MEWRNYMTSEVPMEDNKISIIVPGYNACQYIADCISSVLGQTYKNFELLIVDDGSKDDTLNISKEFANKDKRIKVFHQENGGQPSARNVGLKHATGNYVLFLDADDWLENNCLEIAINECIKNDADVVFYDYIQEFSDKSVVKKSIERYQIADVNDPDTFIYNMKNITAWGKLYRRDCIGNVLFDEQMKTAEDVDFNFKVYSRVKKAVYLKSPLMHYRILNNSAIHGYNPQIAEKFKYPIVKIKEYMMDGDPQKAKAYYSFLAIAYIVICRNMICLDTTINTREKRKRLRTFNKSDWTKELFNNTDKIIIPVSRKALVIFGKFNLNYLTVFSNAIKDRMDK